MEYQAVYEIDGGVSHGFGLKSPDHYKKRETIAADNPETAYQKAMVLAENFADDSLSNPETGLTTVNLLSLIGPEGSLAFDASKSVVKRTTLDHLISVLVGDYDKKHAPKENSELN